MNDNSTKKKQQNNQKTDLLIFFSFFSSSKTLEVNDIYIHQSKGKNLIKSAVNVCVCVLFMMLPQEKETQRGIAKKITLLLKYKLCCE